MSDFSWRDAFDKFGFGDGDDANHTDLVADFIRSLGYVVKTENWFLHNYMISQIFDQDNNQLMKEDEIKVGYDDPGDYLPPRLVAALNERF